MPTEKSISPSPTSPGNAQSPSKTPQCCGGMPGSLLSDVSVCYPCFICVSPVAAAFLHSFVSFVQFGVHSLACGRSPPPLLQLQLHRILSLLHGESEPGAGLVGIFRRQRVLRRRRWLIVGKLHLLLFLDRYVLVLFFLRGLLDVELLYLDAIL